MRTKRPGVAAMVFAVSLTGLTYFHGVRTHGPRQPSVPLCQEVGEALLPQLVDRSSDAERSPTALPQRAEEQSNDQSEQRVTPRATQRHIQRKIRVTPKTSTELRSIPAPTLVDLWIDFWTRFFRGF